MKLSIWFLILRIGNTRSATNVLTSAVKVQQRNSTWFYLSLGSCQLLQLGCCESGGGNCPTHRHHSRCGRCSCSVAGPTTTTQHILAIWAGIRYQYGITFFKPLRFAFITTSIGKKCWWIKCRWDIFYILAVLLFWVDRSRNSKPAPAPPKKGTGNFLQCCGVGAGALWSRK